MAEDAPAAAASSSRAGAGPSGSEDKSPAPAPAPDSTMQTSPRLASNPAAKTNKNLNEAPVGTDTNTTMDMSTSTSTSTSVPVPLESSLRTTAVHPSIPSLKMPASALTDQPNIHPVTLQPFSAAELEKYGYEKLREQVVAGAKGGSGTGGGGGGGGSSSSTGAGSGGGGNVGDSTATSKQTQEIHRIRDETAELLRQKLQDREAKIRQIEREMAEKEKTREVERKVFQKKFGAGKDL